ncbi:MAG: hypothetical protein AMJ88_04995 [Anaerolineae bacterium SM23_ 63]|nr:MAG: hypothetical protein AMJ88_04995 [Anaerolineae bacterium SM23_ 63]
MVKSKVMINAWLRAVNERLLVFNSRGLSLLMLLMVTLFLTACSRAEIMDTLGIEELLGRLGPMNEILRGGAVLAGLVLLVIGWKIYRFVVTFPGFLVGAVFGAWLGYRLSGELYWALFGLILGGVIGAWLARVVHDIAVFAVGAIGGLYVLYNLWGFFAEGSPEPLIGGLSAIFGGLILLVLSRHWMVFLSSAIGATMLIWGIQGNTFVIPILFVLGIILQYWISKVVGEKAFVRSDGFT